MADNTTYGVYVSLRAPNGALWSSSRAEWVEAQRDLDAAFGDGFAAALIESLRREFVVTATPPSTPASAPQPDSPQEQDEAAAMKVAQEVLGAQPEQQEQKQQFARCEICGSLKDRWNPPGISRSGKRYAGFFGCPNFKNHPRK